MRASWALGFSNQNTRSSELTLRGGLKRFGNNVKQFQPGDQVFGDLARCGWGAFAEYAVCARRLHYR